MFALPTVLTLLQIVLQFVLIEESGMNPSFPVISLERLIIHL